jgi:hypothetical protein
MQRRTLRLRRGRTSAGSYTSRSKWVRRILAIFAGAAVLIMSSWAAGDSLAVSGVRRY